MRVLVTGAFGNLGRPTLRELAARGHSVRAFDLPSPLTGRHAKALARELPALEVVLGDIRDEAVVREAVEGVDAVIHDAAILWPATERAPELARAVNVEGTRTLVACLEATGASPTLVLASSVTVFGPDAPDEERTASSSTRGTDEYTRTKLEAEGLVRASSLPWVVLRIGVALDPASRAADREVLRHLFSLSPSQRLEYVDPRDVAVAQAAAVAEPAARGKILLLGGGEGCRVTFGDLFDSLFASLGLARPPDEDFGRESYYTGWMDTEEAERLLRFQRHTFAEYRAAVAEDLATIRRLTWPVRPLLGWALRTHLP